MGITPISPISSAEGSKPSRRDDRREQPPDSTKSEDASLAELLDPQTTEAAEQPATVSSSVAAAIYRAHGDLGPS